MPVPVPAPTPTSGPDAALRDLHPACFALVMATGIVSLAAHLLGHAATARALLAANAAFYVAVWALTLARLARHGDRVLADVLHHGRCVGFFTVVAGTCVLGSQALVVAEHRGVATGLWALGTFLWATLTYGLFTVLAVKREKPSLAEGINGGWLLPVVAAQSVAALGAQLAPGLGPYAQPALLFSLAMWLGGGMLYMWMISLIVYRYMFFSLSPTDLAPPYWINMGAAAISTLAGATLVLAAPSSPVIEQLLPFVRGASLLWWSTATWWIPMLLILGAWRHGVRRFPLRYDPLYWGAVFPLGMYTACTVRLAEALDAAYLLALPRAFFFVAVAAWGLTFVGMLGRMLSLLRAPPPSP